MVEGSGGVGVLGAYLTHEENKRGEGEDERGGGPGGEGGSVEQRVTQHGEKKTYIHNLKIDNLYSN